MAVSGALHLQSLQPGGQVPLMGVTQVSPVSTGPGTSQQSWPGWQQSVPQQVPAGPHSGPSHGGAARQVPESQNGDADSPHTLPHVPQFLMSLSVFTQTSPQQVNWQLVKLQALDAP